MPGSKMVFFMKDRSIVLPRYRLGFDGGVNWLMDQSVQRRGGEAAMQFFSCAAVDFAAFSVGPHILDPSPIAHRPMES